MMFDHLLIPLDGSKSGEVALPFLQRLPLKVGRGSFSPRSSSRARRIPGPGFVEESLQFAEGYLGRSP